MPPQGVLTAGEITLNPGQRRVWCAGREVSLRKGEYNLLHTLMLANGDALSRDEICKLTLGHSDTSNCLSVTVARLREKLGAQARQLVTLKGFGFRLDMDEAENGRKR